MKKSRKIMSFFIICAFTLNVVCPPNIFAQTLNELPDPGTMIGLSSPFNPTVIKGLKLYPQNPLRFDFILDKGTTLLKDYELEEESTRLIKYFLTALTISEDDFWVNLSPYEKDRIVPSDFGVTEMGRDLLAQDYLLKQITASLMYPEGELGKKFWDSVYEKVQEEYGVAEIPLETFNKVWIVPEKAVVYANGDTAYVVESRLRVMLEEDYKAMQCTKGGGKVMLSRRSEESEVGIPTSSELNIKGTSGEEDYVALNRGKEVKELKNPTSVTSKSVGPTRTPATSTVASEVIRQVILPALEKEVNTGKHFAPLRQIYQSLILATWYKSNLKNSLLSKVYIDQSRISGVDIDDKEMKYKIYQKYLDAFKQGVYNFVKEDFDPLTQQIIPRKYFSGGIAYSQKGVRDKMSIVHNVDGAMLHDKENMVLVRFSGGIITDKGEGEIVKDSNIVFTEILSAEEALDIKKQIVRKYNREEGTFSNRDDADLIGQDMVYLKDDQGEILGFLTIKEEFDDAYQISYMHTFLPERERNVLKILLKKTIMFLQEKKDVTGRDSVAVSDFFHPHAANAVRNMFGGPIIDLNRNDLVSKEEEIRLKPRKLIEKVQRRSSSDYEIRGWNVMVPKAKTYRDIFEPIRMSLSYLYDPAYFESQRDFLIVDAFQSEIVTNRGYTKDEVMEKLVSFDRAFLDSDVPETEDAIRKKILSLFPLKQKQAPKDDAMLSELIRKGAVDNLLNKDLSVVEKGLDILNDLIKLNERDLVQEIIGEVFKRKGLELRIDKNDIIVNEPFDILLKTQSTGEEKIIFTLTYSGDVVDMDNIHLPVNMQGKRLMPIILAWLSSHPLVSQVLGGVRISIYSTFRGMSHAWGRSLWLNPVVTQKKAPAIYKALGIAEKSIKYYCEGVLPKWWEFSDDGGEELIDHDDSDAGMLSLRNLFLKRIFLSSNNRTNFTAMSFLVLFYVFTGLINVDNVMAGDASYIKGLPESTLLNYEKFSIFSQQMDKDLVIYKLDENQVWRPVEKQERNKIIGKIIAGGDVSSMQMFRWKVLQLYHNSASLFFKDGKLKRMYLPEEGKSFNGGDSEQKDKDMSFKLLVLRGLTREALKERDLQKALDALNWIKYEQIKAGEINEYNLYYIAQYEPEIIHNIIELSKMFDEIDFDDFAEMFYGNAGYLKNPTEVILNLGVSYPNDAYDIFDHPNLEWKNRFFEDVLSQEGSIHPGRKALLDTIGINKGYAYVQERTRYAYDELIRRKEGYIEGQALIFDDLDRDGQIRALRVIADSIRDIQNANANYPMIANMPSNQNDLDRKDFTKERDDNLLKAIVIYKNNKNDLSPEDLKGLKNLFEGAGDTGVDIKATLDDINKSLSQSDDAMSGDPAVGGIDLNPTKMNLESQGEGISFEFPYSEEEFLNLKIQGLSPIIYEIVPVTNLPLFLGLEKSQSQNSV